MIVNNKKGQNIDLFSKLIQRIVNLKQIFEKNPKKGMTTVKSWFLLIVELLPAIYQLSSDFVKQLLRIQIQKGRNLFLWNQVKSWIVAILNLVYLCLIPAAQPRVLSEESLTALGPPSDSCLEIKFKKAEKFYFGTRYKILNCCYSELILPLSDTSCTA